MVKNGIDNQAISASNRLLVVIEAVTILNVAPNVRKHDFSREKQFVCEHL